MRDAPAVGLPAGPERASVARRRRRHRVERAGGGSSGCAHGGEVGRHETTFAEGRIRRPAGAEPREREVRIARRAARSDRDNTAVALRQSGRGGLELTAHRRATVAERRIE